MGHLWAPSHITLSLFEVFLAPAFNFVLSNAANAINASLAVGSIPNGLKLRHSDQPLNF